jgi:uncharacterized protein YejL (UPF0352 family)
MAILNKHERPGDVALFVLGGLLGDIGVKGRVKTAIKGFAVYQSVVRDSAEFHFLKP